MKKITHYILIDILRSKIIIGYTILLLILSLDLFLLEDVVEKSLMTLLTLNLIFVPLVSLLFSTIYIYNSSEFIELLAAQPVERKSLWLSIFTGLALSLCLAFFVGCGIPMLFFSFNAIGVIMLLTGLLLSIIFVSIACLITVYVKDKTKGIGLSILTWLYFTILFDGLILFLLFQLLDYPLEKLILTLSFLNPIDLARITSLLQLDVSALMGATAAVFRQNLTDVKGILMVLGALLTWAIFPLYLAVRKFGKRDL